MQSFPSLLLLSYKGLTLAAAAAAAALATLGHSLIILSALLNKNLPPASRLGLDLTWGFLLFLLSFRYKRRTLAAAAASEALSEGAAALAALGSREDAFYQQVAQLQQYWKVGVRPQLLHPDQGCRHATPFVAAHLYGSLSTLRILHQDISSSGYATEKRPAYCCIMFTSLL